ncbi:hypothetical protein L837_3002 [Mycobacterium avium MAV_061107_1842]|nr:hypothetical protein L837_3002 [Mycobacterium avium MAV_061107_1842]ETZ52539.1 hypothetical protein L840_5048 [Mycobacterium sp. MAC_011194_8550]
MPGPLARCVVVRPNNVADTGYDNECSIRAFETTTPLNVTEDADARPLRRQAHVDELGIV